MLSTCFKALARISARSVRPAAFFGTKRYTKTDEWIDYDESTKIGKVGISNFAQIHLGEIVFIDFPKVSASTTQGKPMGSLESVKAVAELNSPITGIVKGINEKVKADPTLVNKNAEGKGWIAELSVEKPEELDKLMDSAAYEKHCEEHKDEH